MEISGTLLQLKKPRFSKAKVKAFLKRTAGPEWHPAFCAMYSENVPGAFFNGAGLAIFESEAAMEAKTLPVETYPLEARTKFQCFGPNCFPRIQNAFHFSIQLPGQEPIIFETSEDVREKWLAVLAKVGCNREEDAVAKQIRPKSIKEGYLEKMGKKEVDGGFRVRYCILLLNPNRVEYFVSTEDAVAKKLQGTMFLDENTMTAKLPGTYMGNQHSFTVTVKGGRRFVLSAQDEKEQTSWFEEIERVKGHVPLLARDLAAANEKQRAEFERQEAERRNQARIEYHKQLLIDMQTEADEQKVLDKERMVEIAKRMEELAEEQAKMEAARVKGRGEIGDVKTNLVECKHLRKGFEGEVAAIEQACVKAAEDMKKLEIVHNGVMDEGKLVIAQEEVVMEQELDLTKREQAVKDRDEENALRDKAVAEFAGVMTQNF